MRDGLQQGREACPSQHLPRENLERFVVDRIKGYVLTDGHLAELVELINDELDDSIGEHGERIEIIDREIDQWQGRLERLYDFVETREIEPFRMAKRIAAIQDKLEEMGKVRLQIEDASRTPPRRGPYP